MSGRLGAHRTSPAIRARSAVVPADPARRTRPGRPARSVAFVVGTAVVVACCAVGSAADAGLARRGITSSSVTVAGLGYSAAYVDAQIGARAVFDAVNARGGVHGRRIDFAGWNDDKGSGPADQVVGRQLLADQVFAVVPAITPTFSAAASLANTQVPAFGWGVSTGFCNNPYAFAITGCIVAPGPVRTFPSTWGRLLDQLFRDRGLGGGRGKTAAVVAQQDAAGRQALPAVTAAARAGGFTVGYHQAAVPAPPALPVDYSPYVRAILGANGGAAPDVVFLVLDLASSTALAQGLRAAGYRGVLTNATSYDPRLVGVTAGQTILTQFAVPEAASTDPAMAAVVANIRRSAGAVPISAALLAGYFSADFFVQALQRAGRHVTPASLARTASRMTYTIRGVVGPTRYPTAARLGTPCGALVESTGAAYRVVRRYACFQNVDVHSLRPVRS